MFGICHKNIENYEGLNIISHEFKNKEQIGVTFKIKEGFIAILERYLVYLKKDLGQSREPC
ncbi:hypothetical protein D6777_03535 [Candidatus Woesearchaeota archaeon]|nr:MAG: hypothetical protein D6777_03535 [Candidatus Woesearchaeota archaeon]